MDFRILGPLEVVEDVAPVPLTGQKQRALLALLLLDAGRVVTVERIVDDLWGEDVPATARKMVQIFVSQLRKQLPPAVIETRAGGYRCVLEGHTLDLHRFETLRATGRDALAAGRPDQAARVLREALALWRGTPLAEFDEPFARVQAARLEEQQLTCLEQRIEAELALGHHAELAGELEMLVRSHPLRERLRELQMLALYRSGRQADALAAFADLRHTLRDDLGMEPSPRLRELERLVLQQNPSLDLRAVVPEAPAAPPTPPAAERVAESRRNVTVLVADVTPHDAPVDPEARRAVTHDRLREARDELSRHGARVVPFGGTRLLAVFGMPAAHEDDALRAAVAAVELRAAAPRARIGLASGEVVTGDPLVAGAPVDEAALLQERAEAGEVLSTPRTWRTVRHAVEATERDGSWSIAAVDGDAAPVPRRLGTPLVGRTAELAEIVTAFERAEAGGRPHLVTVFGAPGLGKTRLGIEAADRLRSRATAVVAHCRTGQTGTTYAPLRDVLVELADGDPAVWTRRRLGEESGAHLAEQLNAATGLGTGPAHADDVALATRRLLTGLARRRPLLLVIEDVHWAAPAFLDLIESLVELSHAPLLVLCLARPDLLEERPGWGGGRMSSSTIALDALSPDESELLLRRLAPEGALETAEFARLLALAEGNPLFIEQLFAAAADDGGVALPDSIQTLLAARLDRLAELDRSVVEAAAVAGASFETEDIAPLVEGDVHPSLVTLVRRELIRPGVADNPGGAGWSFRHSLIRDVAYTSIPKRRRADLHELLAARADERGADADAYAAFHLDEALRALTDTGGADEHRLARLQTEAAHRMRRAGFAAADREDYTGASALLKRANELLARDAPERVELLLRLADMLLWVDGGSTSSALLEEARTLASELGDDRLQARVAIGRGLTLMWTDLPVPPEHMLRDVENAVPVLERHGDHEGLAMAELLRFHALDQAGLPGPEDRLPIALSYARQAPSSRVDQTIMGWLCITLPHGAVPIDEALARVDDIRRTSSSAYVHAAAIGARGLLRAAQGALDEGRSLVQTTRRALEELGHRQAAAAHWIAIGEVELLAGDDAAAERALRKGYEDTTAIADQHSTANVAWRLGLALAHQRKHDEAEQFAAIAQQTEFHGLWVDVWWRVVLALVAAHRGDAATSVLLVHAARDRIASAAGARSGMEADVLLESARALRAAGRPEEAAAFAADAASIAARLGYVVAERRARTA